MHTTYEITVPLFTNTLKGLKIVLEKTKVYIQEKSIDEKIILEDRLFEDMFPFIRQVQVVSDTAKGSAARLMGTEAPSFPDTENSIDELLARIDKTILYLESLTPEMFAGAEERKITYPFLPGKFILGKDMVKTFALPNFFFHVSIAYAIARKNGVPVGKMDYLSMVPFQDIAS